MNVVLPLTSMTAPIASGWSVARRLSHPAESIRGAHNGHPLENKTNTADRLFKQVPSSLSETSDQSLGWQSMTTNERLARS
jgi:hypothetical protein